MRKQHKTTPNDVIWVLPSRFGGELTIHPLPFKNCLQLIQINRNQMQIPSLMGETKAKELMMK
eukprot:716268-Amphidinium_carterae.1